MEEKSKRIFFVTRMFSGLFETFSDKEWKPTGIPTIVKLVEKISKKNDFKWIIVCRTEQESKIVKDKFTKYEFDGIKIEIIPFKIFSSIGRINYLINDYLAFKYISKIKDLGNCLFYCDRSNIILAALIKKIFKAKVIVRILGVYPDQKKLALNTFFKMSRLLTYIAYKVKYDFAICTQDGSGVEYYIDKLVNKNTKREVLINGVKKNNELLNKRNGRKISLLFVGKLIEDKGINELISSIRYLKENNENFILNIVGKGPLEEELMNKTERDNIQKFVNFIGSVKQDEIHQFYDNADIYISLNKLGNLSNTVLEAMIMNKCIVMLGKDEKYYTDLYTDKVIPEKTVIKIDRNNIVNDLNEKLKTLIDNPDKILEYSNNMKQFAEKFLWTWDERIDYEIDLLEKVLN